MVVTGRLSFQICRQTLREQKGARYTSKFDGTTFNALRNDGKDMRLSVFHSGRFNVPGVKYIKEAKMALVQNYRAIHMSRDTAISKVDLFRPGRNTTRKRRRVRDW